MALSLFAPGVNETRNCPAALRVALTAVGAAGAPTVMAGEAVEFGPVPKAFLAATLNVYVVPFVRPVMVAVVAAVLRTRCAWAAVPMNGVTMYPVTGDPLSLT